MLTHEALAYQSTKGYRKEARRRVRNALGTSADPAPTAYAACFAAAALDEILKDGSAGLLTLKIHDRNGNTLTFGEARNRLDAEAYGRDRDG